MLNLQITCHEENDGQNEGVNTSTQHSNYEISATNQPMIYVGRADRTTSLI